MVELTEGESVKFIRLFFWVLKFNNLINKLKEDYLNLDPTEFKNDNEYVSYSNILKRINNNFYLIQKVINSLAFMYSINIDYNSGHFAVLKSNSEHISSITELSFINRNPIILGGQWNCIINELLYFIENRYTTLA